MLVVSVNNIYVSQIVARIAVASRKRPKKEVEFPGREIGPRLPEVYTHTPPRILREQAVLEFATRRISPPPPRNRPRFSRGGASRSIPSFESDPALPSFAFERDPRLAPRDRRSSQRDTEKETVRPVHFRVASRITRSIYLTPPPSPCLRIYSDGGKETEGVARHRPVVSSSTIKPTSLLFVLYIYVYQNHFA